jgi:hypothetical protein
MGALFLLVDLSLEVVSSLVLSALVGRHPGDLSLNEETPMPLKVNVGLSKKVGEENYGSRGASVHVEMELDGSLVNDPAKLQERIRQLFGLVRTSVVEELNGTGGPASNGNRSNGHAEAKNGGQTTNVRPATQSQAKAIFAITKSQGIDMTHLLRERYRVDRPEDLSIKEASALIDQLKKSGNGKAG